MRLIWFGLEDEFTKSSNPVHNRLYHFLNRRSSRKDVSLSGQKGWSSAPLFFGFSISVSAERRTDSVVRRMFRLTVENITYLRTISNHVTRACAVDIKYVLL